MTGIEEIIGELKSEIDKTILENNLAGIAISLVDDKDILWLDCFGYSDLEAKVKVNPDTIFSIQSIGKVFTTVGFMRAVTKGLISIDDKLIDYYPEFTVNSKYGDPQVEKITFRHLLAHFAGFTHRSKVGGEYDHTEPTWEEYIKSIPDTWLRYPVGDRFLYSNLGMALAAFCLEKVSGIKFPDYIQKEICSPLDITSLVYGKKASLQNPNRAIGYQFGHIAEYSNLIFYGAGGQFLSVKDMARFVQFLLKQGTVDGVTHVRKDLLDEMARIQFNKIKETKKYYGLGLFVDKETIDGLEIRYHSGGGCGYSAHIAWNIEYKIGVIVLTNSYPSQNAMRICDKALISLLKFKGAKISSPIANTPATFITKPKTTIDINSLKKLEGLYTISGGKFEFKIINDQPIAFYLGRQIPLYTHSEVEFTADIPIGMKFLLDEKNKPYAADVLVPEGVVHRFNYQKENEEEVFGPNKISWKKFEGLYSTTYLGDPIYFAVKVDNGHLKILLNNQGEILTEYNNNIFFTNDERAVIFHEKFFYYDNIKMNRLDNPVTPISELVKKDPNNRFLSKMKIKELYFNLDFLGRNGEAEEIAKILFQLYPEEEN
ncbi:MAG TPA: serine hydrolase domain-containing protein [Candidatus Bathyarchaeia archaeon]|nr:serine hydrolase domain-containing protein [Candidatus Bathyarchaeia archaeon]